MKAGKSLKITYTDHNGKKQVITSAGCNPEDEEVEIEMGQVQSDGFYEIVGESWSMTVRFEPISWDETWLVAYQARMYANYFRS